VGAPDGLEPNDDTGRDEPRWACGCSANRGAVMLGLTAGPCLACRSVTDRVTSAKRVLRDARARAEYEIERVRSARIELDRLLEEERQAYAMRDISTAEPERPRGEDDEAGDGGED
jgi:hypothetical protein